MMKRILIVHDGAPISEEAKLFLAQELREVKAIDLLYVIEQNLVHYGQVDQLATPICKNEFIEYVQNLGVEECKERLEPFVLELKALKASYNYEIEFKLHVRWGDICKAIAEIVDYFNNDMLIIPQNAFGINWALPKNSTNLTPKLAEILRVL